MRTYEIDLKGCAFFAYHGVLPEEERLGQRFLIDVRLTVEDRGALAEDRLDESVHYGEAFGEIEKVVTQTRRRLIETLANDIATALCARWPTIRHAVVTVHKPSAPIAGILDDVAVTVALENEA